jgi:hypothetical protein
MSQEGIWNLQISFVGSGEEAGRADGIIVTARKRGKAVYGEAPWWNVSYEAFDTRAAALAALSAELDEIDRGWREILAARLGRTNPKLSRHLRESR